VHAGGGPRLAAGGNPIVAENALPGTQGWNAGTNGPVSGIDGYTSQLSVTPGQDVQLHITAAAGTRYRIEIYRLGWYQGIGARLLTCVPSCTSDEAAAPRPPTPALDPVTGYVDAGWPVTDDVTTGSNWVSGYYMAKLVVTVGAAGQVRFIPFVVRETSPVSPILVQVPVNTWEAYNNWGGKSLYTAGSTGGVAATVVSFNRPFITTGLNWPMAYEYPLVRFLESRGYFVSYATDIDTDQGVDAPGARSLVITAGHDEYWTKQIRDQLDAAQSTGTNLVVMGANTGYWQMRYDPTYRTIYEYRSALLDPDPNPATKTVRFRQLTPSRPECALEGEQETGGLNASPANPNFSVATGALTNPWFNGTGFTQPSQITGVVGYEWDTAGQPGCPVVQTLFTWSGTNVYGAPSTATSTMFTAPSGARVFDAGSFQFSWALDSYGHAPPVNPSAQLFMQNVLDDLSRPLAPTPVAPTNTAAPSISGTAAVGLTLTATNGIWGGYPAPAFTYQWSSCDQSGANCSTITGATGNQYTLQPADAGHELEATVTATNSLGAPSSTSDPSAIVTAAPGNTARPSITGSAVAGATLTAVVGIWTGSPTSYLYTWSLCDAGGNNCTAISGAANATYTVARSDAGSTLEVAVIATNDSGRSTAATSLPTATVTSAPVNTRAPTIAGTAAENQVLSASTGSWTATPSPSYAYQWSRCDAGGANCHAIPGATGAAYTARAADVGTRLRVAITATNLDGAATASSAAIAAVSSRIGHPTSKRATVSKTTAAVLTGCQGGVGAKCPLTVTLTITETLKGGKVIAVAARRTRHKTVSLGRVTVTLAAGQTRTIRIGLNKLGKRLLAAHHILRVTLTIAEGSSSAHQTVTFKYRRH
jgi:hypothetical protein